ncbi:hypothetical protein ABIF86_007150 [Bradyrhizobium japonicum]
MDISEVVLATADRGPILQVISSFDGKSPDSWLSGGHPAADGSLPLLWRDVNNIPHPQLIEAVSASAPNHCMDGWSYIARAKAAFLAGDLHAARHLAYYAQLRAALSMLGHLGIGVFNGINFVVNANGGVARLDPQRRTEKGLGTHAAVWVILDKWVSDPRMARQFLGMVRVAGIALASCLDAVWPGASTTAVAGNLVEAWGVDLKRGRDDHRSRNMSSYNPQALQQMPDQVADRVLFIESVWSLFEPTSSSSFDLVDRLLLRSMLWQQHEVVSPQLSKRDGAIGRRYEHLPEAVRNIASIEFLCGESEAVEPTLITAAKSNQSPALPTEMIARALLLLRAATAFTVSNFSDAGIRLGEGKLRAWTDPIAVARGFWKPASALANPIDLWDDIKVALEELAASNNPPPTSMKEWMERSPIGLPTLTEAERIGVWSLGS